MAGQITLEQLSEKDREYLFGTLFPKLEEFARIIAQRKRELALAGELPDRRAGREPIRSRRGRRQKRA